MEITEAVENEQVTLYIEGEIDGTNADEFEEQLRAAADKTENLVVDLSKLEYISSAGLRSFLMVTSDTPKISLNWETLTVESSLSFCRMAERRPWAES